MIEGLVVDAGFREGLWGLGLETSGSHPGGRKKEDEIGRSRRLGFRGLRKEACCKNEGLSSLWQLSWHQGVPVAKSERN